MQNARCGPFLASLLCVHLLTWYLFIVFNQICTLIPHYFISDVYTNRVPPVQLAASPLCICFIWLVRATSLLFEAIYQTYIQYLLYHRRQHRDIFYTCIQVYTLNIIYELRKLWAIFIWIMFIKYALCGNWGLGPFHTI